MIDPGSPRKRKPGQKSCRLVQLTDTSSDVLHLGSALRRLSQRGELTRGLLRARMQMLLDPVAAAKVAVEFAKPGELAVLTGIESRQKPIRLLDQR